MTYLNYSISDTEVVSNEKLHNEYLTINLVCFRHRLFSGGWSGVVKRELLVRGDTVAVLLYDPVRDSVVMIEQIRIGAFGHQKSPWQLEFVAGVVEAGEGVQDVAVRETEEESGIQIINPRLLFKYYNSPGITDETTSLFYAEVDSTNVSGIHGLDEENEDIKVHVVSRQDVLTLCADGTVVNCHVILGMHWLELSLR